MLFLYSATEAIAQVGSMSLLQAQGDFRYIVRQYGENPYPALDFSDYPIRKNKTALLGGLCYTISRLVGCCIAFPTGTRVSYILPNLTDLRR